MDSLPKEIDLIQDVIKRMSNNSFLIKGWYVTIISGLLAFSKDILNTNVPYLIMLLPTLLFWYLDSFYLRQEALFRKLYEWVIVERSKGNSDYLYDLNARKRFHSSTKGILKTMFSNTLTVFYFFPLLILLLMIIKFSNLSS